MAKKMVRLQCDNCERQFERSASEHKRDIEKRGWAHTYCSYECMGIAYRSNDPEQQCEQCGKTFIRRWVQKFCSRSCSATFNNAKRRRERPPKIKPEPKLQGEDYTVTTLDDLKKRMHPRQAHAKVRGLSRNSYKQSGQPMACFVCGYDRHIDVSHIQGVATFDGNTPIATINDISNLIALCKNHHWEFDNGYLKF